MKDISQLEIKEVIFKKQLVSFSSTYLQDRDAKITTLNIAQAFDRKHDNVLKLIENNKPLLFGGTVLGIKNPCVITESSYIDSNDKKNKMYVLNGSSAMVICEHLYLENLNLFAGENNGQQ